MSHQGLLETDAGLEVDLGSIALCCFGGDDDNTAGSGSTVKGGCRCILKDGEGLDVVGVECTAGDTVNHVQRASTCGDGTGTTDADVCSCTGLAGGVHYHNAGDLTLEHVTNIRGGYVRKLFRAHGYDGTGKFRLLL